MKDELNSDARRLVDLARTARSPNADDRQRVAKRLAGQLAMAGAAATGATKLAAAAPAGKALGGSLLSGVGLKLAAAGAIAAGVAAVWVWKAPASAPSAPIPDQAASIVPPRAEAPARAIPAASASVTTEPVDVPRAKPPVPSAAPATARPTHSADELVAEAALLHEAQLAWRAGRSDQALSLAQQHARRFPRSQLANERDVLLVLSLCQSGQTKAAKQIGARLLRTSKGSPWYQSVAGSCAAK